MPLYELNEQVPVKQNLYIKLILKWSGFEPIPSNQCIFISQYVIILWLFVDDGTVFCKNINDLNYVEGKLAAEFDVKLYNIFDGSLGFDVTMDKEMLKLDQVKYIEKLLR